MMIVIKEAMITHGVTNLNPLPMEIGLILAYVQQNRILQLSAKIAWTSVKNVDLATFGVTKTPLYGDIVHLINY